MQAFIKDEILLLKLLGYMVYHEKSSKQLCRELKIDLSTFYRWYHGHSMSLENHKKVTNFLKNFLITEEGINWIKESQDKILHLNRNALIEKN